MKSYDSKKGIIATCEPERNEELARWVIERCAGPLFTLNRYVPSGFEEYVRVFHPCWRWPDGKAQRFEDTRHLTQYISDPVDLAKIFEPMRWAEVAALNDHDLTSQTRFWDIMPCTVEDSSKPGGTWGPLEGTTEASVIETLADALIPYSGEDQECLVAVWYGFGTDEIRALEQRGCALIEGVGQQQHFILRGKLGEILRTWRSLLPDQPVPGSNSDRWPQALWPTTKDWFFAVPFELESSYFAGPRKLSQLLLNDPRIECLSIPLDADFRSP